MHSIPIIMPQLGESIAEATVMNFLVGQVMRASKGQANPALLNELVTKKLDG